MRGQEFLALETFPATLALQVPLLVGARVRLESRQVGEDAVAGRALGLVLGRDVVIELPSRVESRFAAIASVMHRVYWYSQSQLYPKCQQYKPHVLGERTPGSEDVHES